MKLPESVLDEDGAARRLLESAAVEARIVVFCGIPGVGKSLLLREQQLLALHAGRRVSRLEWDVARQAFELPAILSRYPEIDGSTHVVIRRAVGLWLRAAIEHWRDHHQDPAELLLIEAPLVGGRFMELARAIDDGAEPILRAAAARFYVPTPTREVRLAIEAARRDETIANRHARDAANASPRVVDELWRMVAATARSLGLASAETGTSADAASSYSPDVYYSVYASVLKHRHVSRVPIETVIADRRSPHALDWPVEELQPTGAQTLDLIALAEREGVESIADGAARWYLT